MAKRTESIQPESLISDSISKRSLIKALHSITQSAFNAVDLDRNYTTVTTYLQKKSNGASIDVFVESLRTIDCSVAFRCRQWLKSNEYECLSVTVYNRLCSISRGQRNSHRRSMQQHTEALMWLQRYNTTHVMTDLFYFLARHYIKKGHAPWSCTNRVWHRH